MYVRYYGLLFRRDCRGREMMRLHSVQSVPQIFPHLVGPNALAMLVVGGRDVGLWSNVRSRRARTVVAARGWHWDSFYTQSQLWNFDAANDVHISTSTCSHGSDAVGKELLKTKASA